MYRREDFGGFEEVPLDDDDDVINEEEEGGLETEPELLDVEEWEMPRER